MDWLNESQDAMNFGYDAVEDTGRRRSVKRVVASEDRQLQSKARNNLTATARDSRRNFVTTRWAVHKHIDFVVDHKFQASTGDEAFDQQLNQFFEYASRPENFDISGRHSLQKFMRLAEAARIIDGDFFAIRTRGGYLQAIESDRVKDPENDKYGRGFDSDASQSPWTQGVKTNSYGRPMQYAIHKRMPNGYNYEFERTISSSRVIPLGFYDRFDQVRGISPMACAINYMRSLNESFDYTLAKGAVAQQMALVVTREADWGFSQDDPDDPTPDRVVNFSKGPQILDMEPGEDAKFLTANIPGEETAAFWQEMTALVLKSLNIPYSFFQENHTNFFGSRSALILYLRSVQQWRDDVTKFMNDWLCWRLKVGQLKGEINMPDWFECEPINWTWIPTGIQYWDPAKEISADQKAIELGLRTRSEIRAERFGDDWETAVLPQLMKEDELMLEMPSSIREEEKAKAQAEAMAQQQPPQKGKE